MNNGGFDYVIRATWAPEDALTKSIRQEHINALGDGKISDIKYELLKTIGNLKLYEKNETTYEIVSETMIPNGYTFWKAGAIETGQISVPILSNAGDILTTSNSARYESLKIVVEAGNESAPFIYHIYEENQDWSEYNYTGFQWYGQNSGKRVQIILWTPDIDNWTVGYSIMENWFGWKQIIIPLGGFEALKGTYGLTRVRCIQIWFGDNTQGTWYLNQVMLVKVRVCN